MYLDEIRSKSQRDPEWLDSVQFGHHEGTSDLLNPDRRQALEQKPFKGRDPATNEGTIEPSHWFCGNRLLAMIDSGRDPGCDTHDRRVFGKIPKSQSVEREGGRVIWSYHDPVGPDYQLIEDSRV